MLPALANAPADNPPPAAGELLAAYAAHLACTGRGHCHSEDSARSFLRRWPIPQSWADEPLPVRLGINPTVRAFVTFLMMHGWLRPGYDYLVARKLSSFWRDAAASPVEADMERFRSGAEAIGFTPIHAVRVASQSVGRLVVQTGRRLDELTLADFDDLTAACREREARTGKGWDHYRSALNAAHRVLFHLEVLDVPPPHWQGPMALADRLADVDGHLRPTFVAYLERKSGTCKPKTVSSMRLACRTSVVSSPRSIPNSSRWLISTANVTSSLT